MSQQTGSDNVSQWFLRTGGEAVFGPVTREGLIVWAEQGRILPGHEVSTDRKKWGPAVSVDFLDMRWYVSDGDDDLRGPLNRLAAETLIKSGKVSEQAQIVSADEVDPLDAEEEERPAPAPTLRGKSLPPARQPIQELELGLPPPRNKPSAESAKKTDALQQERNALAAKVEELGALHATLQRNAEKESRAAEKRVEQLRQKLKEQEAEIEDLNVRLTLASQPAAPVVDEALVRERDDLLVRLGEVCRERDELHAAAVDQDDAFKNLLQRVAELEQKIQADAQVVGEAQHALDTSENVILQLRNELHSWQQACQKSTAAEQSALARMTEVETDLADLLAMSNARDTEYTEKIAALEKRATQSPEEIAKFYADQSAIYHLFKREQEVVTKALEQERSYFEQLKQIASQRIDSLQERKQTLLKQLGSSPAEMTRLSAREQLSDPATIRIRNEFDNLRFTHEREMRQSEEREHELQRKLQLFESEVGRLRDLALEGERLARRVQELTELLRRREGELADERENYEAERVQFQGNQKALLTRIETLERGARPEAPEVVQASDAKSVKLASWMRFKQ
ncbi:MAG: hypothetical protein FWH21_09500 [Kiritimatiellaeota bacterium]|nr:hypothetical protein [Kiritimatiellota bacterium]